VVRERERERERELEKAIQATSDLLPTQYWVAGFNFFFLGRQYLSTHVFGSSLVLGWRAHHGRALDQH
jgi:hypothetical protein